ncbi:MAG: lysine biosynthesis protein LysX [Planctomycetota bacterium]
MSDQTPRVALLYTRIRTEERLLLDSFESLGAEAEPIDLRRQCLNPLESESWQNFDIAIDRCVSLTASQTLVPLIEAAGLRVVNSARAAANCADKVTTTSLLAQAGIPVPATRVCVGGDAAFEAIHEIGYPAVVKPSVGSWGRLVARVNDDDAAEALIEHRTTLGGPQQQVFYIQEHIAKPGRDLRVFVVGGEPIAAIARSSEHWVTNTARGAQATGLAISDELGELSVRAAEAMTTDICAVDFLECPERGLLVNEINHSLEFRNSIDTTGVDIPGLIAGHTLSLARTGSPA